VVLNLIQRVRFGKKYLKSIDKLVLNVIIKELFLVFDAG
jgi:hypothetical protein